MTQDLEIDPEIDQRRRLLGVELESLAIGFGGALIVAAPKARATETDPRADILGVFIKETAQGRFGIGRAILAQQPVRPQATRLAIGRRQSLETRQRERGLIIAPG